MRLLQAMGFVAVMSLKNRVRSQFTRMRQPRYLITTGFGFAYVWFVLLRRVGMGPLTDVGVLPLVQLVLAGLVTGALGTAWVMGGEEGAIQFSEAEVQFLFPAPANRRSLLHYKLVLVLVSAGWSALVATPFLGARFTTHWVLFFLGSWVGFAGLGLHLVAASLTRAAIAEQGLNGIRRRLLTLLVLASVVGMLVVGALASQGPPLSGGWLALAVWAAKVMDAAPLWIALWPVRQPLALALAQSPLEFARYLPTSLGIVVAHYLWVTRAAGAYEDAAVAGAEKRTRTLETLRAGRGTLIARVPPPFALGSHGPVELAFVWRSLIAAFRTMSLRFVLALVIVLVVFAVAGLAVSDDLGGRAAVAAAVAVAAAGYFAALGPQTLVLDLRLDRQMIDIVRTWPISGARVVAGSLLGEWWLLTLAEWLALVLSLGFSALSPALPVSWSVRLGVAAGGVVLLPSLTLAGLVVQNAWFLLFPSLAIMDGRPGGFDAFGQRLLMLLMNQVILLTAVIPAAVIGIPCFFLLDAGVAWIAAAVAASGILVLECALVVWWLGRVFDRFEPVPVTG